MQAGDGQAQQRDEELALMTKWQLLSASAGFSRRRYECLSRAAELAGVQ